jgi:plasmid replication initiation protein
MFHLLMAIANLYGHFQFKELTVFQNFHKHVEIMFSRKLISIQTYEGGEFHSLIPYFSTNEILHRLACPYTHQ